MHGLVRSGNIKFSLRKSFVRGPKRPRMLRNFQQKTLDRIKNRINNSTFFGITCSQASRICMERCREPRGGAEELKNKNHFHLQAMTQTAVDPLASHLSQVINILDNAEKRDEIVIEDLE